MVIYVDKITMDFNTHGREAREPLARRHEGSADPNPNHCERQCVRCKNIRTQCVSREEILVKQVGM